MVISAGNPVRLDPWQNIVNVSWSPKAPPVYEGFVTEVSGNNPRVSEFEVTMPAYNVGDLLVAQVSTGDAIPSGITTFSGPSGWEWIDRETMSGGIRLNELLGTDSLWGRFMQPGDESSYVWTADQSVQFLTGVSRISNARQIGFPAALAFRESDTAKPGFSGSGVDVPVVPSIVAPGAQNLLLTLMGVASNQSVATRYVVDPAFPAQTKAFHKTMSMSPYTGLGHAIVCFHEVWPNAGATGTRTISTFWQGRENVWHLAISPP